jgi:hypothetical protein
MPGEFVLARVILNGFGYVDPLFWLIWTTHKKTLCCCFGVSRVILGNQADSGNSFKLRLQKRPLGG